MLMSHYTTYLYRERGSMLRPLRMLHLATWMALAAYAQDTQITPKSYDCYRTPTPINIDGKLMIPLEEGQMDH